MNTLYFSRNCNHCKEFLMELKNMNLIQQFKFICIDGNRNLPNFLREIPTIITSDYADPLAGDHAFKWLSFKKQQLINSQEKELDGFGFGGSSSSFADLGNTVGLGAPDGNMGGMASLEQVGQNLMDKNLRNDPRINDTQRQQMLEQKFVIPRN